MEKTKKYSRKVRMVTFNIHMWTTGEGTKNVHEVITELQKLKPDIICFQEVAEEIKLDTIGRVFGYQYYSARCNKWLANAILSRFPFQKAETLVMNINENEERSFAHSILRVPLFDDTFQDSDFFDNNINNNEKREAVGSVDLSINTTHLDHYSETTRVGQLELIFDTINNDVKDDHIICGDFNSLNFSDYSSEKLAEIEEVRHSNSWPSISSSVTDLIHSHLYKDCWIEGGRKGIVETCWAGTRIDYIFASNLFFDQKKRILFYKTTSENAIFSNNNRNFEENSPRELIDEKLILHDHFPKVELTRKLINCEHSLSMASDHNIVVLDFLLSATPL